VSLFYLKLTSGRNLSWTKGETRRGEFRTRR
jgi:hypothetical protein